MTSLIHYDYNDAKKKTKKSKNLLKLKILFYTLIVNGPNES